MNVIEDTSVAGFKIIIHNPEYHTIDGEKVLKIKHNRILKAIFVALIDKPGSFTGNELKFVREYLDLTQTEFVDHFVLSGTHARVSKWEKHEDDCPDIEPAVAVAIRMGMARKFEEIDQASYKAKLDKMADEGILIRKRDLYLTLVARVKMERKDIHIDLQSVA